LEIPEGPWQDISIDMIGPLPRSNGKDAIVVIVDRFTKMIRLMATTTNISSEGIAKIYRDEIWKIHGIPKTILSDRGPQFASKFMEDFTKALGTRRKLSTAYHPQTDGQTERINQEIGTFLRHYVNYKQDDWTEWLAMAEFAYNDKKHGATGRTPFELNFGRHPWKGNMTVQTEIPRIEKFMKNMQESWKHAAQAMEEAQKNMKRQFDKKRRNPQGLKVGDHVWLENKNIQSNRPSKKLDNKRYGPFRISKDIGLGAFQLELPEGWAIHNVFNEDLLTRCVEPKFKGQHMEPAPPPTIINEEEEYEVEEVRKHRKRGRGTQYLVHWKGYGDEHDQWIAETGLPHAKQAVEDYWTRYSSRNL